MSTTSTNGTKRAAKRASTRARIAGATITAAFDFASRYAAETVDVAILDPSRLGEKVDTGVRIRIRSLYSKEARDAAERATAPLTLANGTVDDAAVADASFDRNLFEQTIGITVTWWIEGHTTDTIIADGREIPCTPESVRALYADPKTQWVQKQILAAYLDLARFFGAPKTA